MVSLLVHAFLGVVVIALVIRSNPAIFSRVRSGPSLSTLEIVYYVIAIASLPICWYFNVRYVYEYADNPFWGKGGDWSEFIKLGYANPAASSASADYTIMSLLIFPVWAIVDGRRHGIKRAWLYCGFLLFAGSTFAWAFYLATAERQRRHRQAAVAVESRA